MITDVKVGINVIPEVFFEHHICQHALQYTRDIRYGK
jgi:hypothetical protein